MDKVLINDDLMLNNENFFPREYLYYLNIPWSIFLKSNDEAHTVYMTGEKGEIIFSKDFLDYDRALLYAKESYMKAYLKELKDSAIINKSR